MVLPGADVGFSHFTGGGFPVSGLTIQLPQGHTYTYDYTTFVTFNEPDATSGSQAKKDVGFKLTCTVAIEPVFAKGNHMLVNLKVRDNYCFFS